MKTSELYEFFYKANESAVINKNKGNMPINLKENFKPSLFVIKLLPPHIELICKDERAENNMQNLQFFVELDNDFIKNLIKKDVNDWATLIEENKIIYNAQKFIKYEDVKMKRMKSFSKKKDLSPTLIQFLKVSKNEIYVK